MSVQESPGVPHPNFYSIEGYTILGTNFNLVCTFYCKSFPKKMWAKKNISKKAKFRTTFSQWSISSKLDIRHIFTFNQLFS